MVNQGGKKTEHNQEKIGFGIRLMCLQIPLPVLTVTIQLEGKSWRLSKTHFPICRVVITTPSTENHAIE